MAAKPRTPEKDLWRRRVQARLIDALVALVVIPSALAGVITGTVPVWAAEVIIILPSLWFLASDAVPLGKRLRGLRVVDAATGAPCSLNQSITRNLPFTVSQAAKGTAALVAGVPWKEFEQAHPGLALGILGAGLAVAFVEANRVDKGLPRLGDQWAGTRVILAETEPAAPAT